jgi:hypothetical protein
MRGVFDGRERGARKIYRQMIFMERYGLIIGIALLLSVLVCAYVLARKAARNVEQFREDHHKSFLGDKRP